MRNLEAGDAVDVFQKIAAPGYLTTLAVAIFQIPDAKGGYDPYLPSSQLQFVENNNPPRFDFLKTALSRMVDKLSRKARNNRKNGFREGVGLSSLVFTSTGEARHVPMVDIDRSREMENIAQIADNANKAFPVDTKVFILESGKSGMHVYADIPGELPTIDQLCDIQEQLGGDPNYVKRTKQRQYAVLRAGAFPPEKPQSPRLVLEFKTTRSQYQVVK